MMLFICIAVVIRKSCDETKQASRLPGHNAIKCAAERGVMNASSALKQATALALEATAAGACFAAALFVMASNVSAAQGFGQVNVQGEWAYTTRERDDGKEYMATIHAAEDSAWLLLACSPDKRLTVSLIHTGQFPFPLKPSSSVQLRSNNVPTFSIEGKTVESNLIFVDPWPLRHIMPVIVQDDQLVVSIPEQNGTMHDYTFSIQPNDLALRPIHSGCFDF